MSENFTTPVEYLFVYGTLRLGTGHPLADRLQREADYLGPAFTQGLLYLISHYPGLVRAKTPTDQVSGDLFRLRPDSNLLERLDEFEECGRDFSEPTEYLRRPAHVTLSGGDPFTAWLYWYNWPVKKLSRIASGDFLSIRTRFPH